MPERELRDENAERAIRLGRLPAPPDRELDSEDEDEENDEPETTLAILPPPAARNQPATPETIAEMATLLKAAAENPTSKTVASVLAKRPWLRRGKAAFENYDTLEECPPEERPFRAFFDQVHELVIERMLKAADYKREGDGRLYHDVLGRLWPAEYSKYASDKASSGPSIIIVEGRPARELAPEHFIPTPDDEPDLAA